LKDSQQELCRSRDLGRTSTRIALYWRAKRLYVAEPAKLGRAQLRMHGLSVKHDDDAVRVATVIAGSTQALGCYGSPFARTRWNYQRFVKDYLRCIGGIDARVGAKHDLARNTLVVYASDQIT
jgi:hypothetical protein